MRIRFDRYTRLRLYLKIRYLLFSFRKPLKIGFLRLYNEHNTILPCLMSVAHMFDKIVLIYSRIDDDSLEIAEKFVKDNKLEEKFIIRRYPHEVYTQHSPKYQEKHNWENTLAAYYKFGWDICRKFARFRNGFIAKIDADQIYMNDCFQEIEDVFLEEKYAVVVNSYGGYDGYVNEAENTYMSVFRSDWGWLNGNFTDHLCVPFGLCRKIIFTMDIAKDHAWEVTKFNEPLEKFYTQNKRTMWFHLNRKLPKDGVLRPLPAAHYKEYIEKIQPILEKSNSDYAKLNVIHE